MPSRILLIALITLTIPYFAANSQAQQSAAVREITEAERLYIRNQTTPPAQTSGWETVTLKDVWNLRQRLQYTEAWYRTSIQFEGADEEQALFIPRISSNASFWLNGVEIGNTGSFVEPMPRNWNFPVFISIAPQLIRPGSNELAIRLKTDPVVRGFLFEAYIGSEDLLADRYNRSFFLKITAAKILSTVLALIAGLVAVFYFTTNISRGYLWFAAGTFAWVISSMVFFVRYPPSTLMLWESFCNIALFTAVIFYSKCIGAIANVRRPLVEKSLWCALALQCAGYLLLPDLYAAMFRLVFLGIAVMIIIGLGIYLCVLAVKPRMSHRLWIGLTGLSIVLLVGYDVVMAQQQITSEFAKFPYVPLLATIGGASVFIGKLIQQVRENQTLRDQRVEIENAARADALKNERQRLMQEIHDGVGGQLVSTLARLEKNRTVDTGVVETLRTSIDDLRLIVHSLDNLTQYGDVITLLATIRERMEKNLRQQGIHMAWQVEPVPPIDNFSSENALQLLRIVQEAITNTIKHADASLISLRCYPQDKDNRQGITIQIHDDGKGFAIDSQSVGFGLRNMHDRAAKLGGAFSVQSDPTGTSIEIWLPAKTDDLALVKAN